VGEFEAVPREEFLRRRAHFIGEEGGPPKILRFSEGNRVFEEEGAVALSPMIGVDHDVFHEDHKSSHHGGNGEEEVHHADDSIVAAEHKNPASAWFFENETNSSFLGLAVRGEVRLRLHELHHEARQIGEILNGRRFDVDLGI
jgi:hypothetical protein